jgi:PAS domain S-box-containing protein
MNPAKEGSAAIADAFFIPMSQEQTDERLARTPEPVTLTLDEGGVILDCSKSCERLFGYFRSDLLRQHISRLFPQFTGVALVQNSQINSRLGFLCHCGHRFQAQGRHGNTIFSELSFVQLDNAESKALRMIVRPDRQYGTS